MPRKNQGTRPHVVILGAGFGGIKAAKLLADKDVDVTIVDKHNYHLFQPLLYQVSTSILSEDEISEEQEKLLEALGLRLSKEDTNESRWNIFYELLTEYKKEFGDFRVTKSYDKELHIWVGLQRRAFKRKTLIQERIDKLNGIQFDWTVNTTTKEKNAL